MTNMDFLTDRPIAHRGLHDGNVDCYENSPSAFRAAIERGFAIELDVHLAADGDVVVFHDDTLERLTARTGAVAGLPLVALREIALGQTLDRIPSLKDVLTLVAGRVTVVIEMKDNGERNADLAKAVAAVLAGYDGPVAVMSFEQDILAAYRGTGSTVPFGLTAEGSGTLSFERHRKALPLGITFVSYHVKALPNDFVTHVRETLSMPVITWTVRTPEDVAATREFADQMTFEGFDPDAA